MSSSESDATESDVDRIRRNDKSLTEVEIDFTFRNDEIIEILGALKNNTVVKKFTFRTFRRRPENQEELLAKLLEVMRCNKSVTSLTFCLRGGLLRQRLFATMATSGGWSSIQQLVIESYGVGNVIEHLSLRETEHLSSFIIQSDNLRTLSLAISGGNDAVPIVEILPRTKVESLKISFVHDNIIQNGGRQLATALERCTCITELQLELDFSSDEEFFQILLVESIPKMLGLKKFELEMELLDQQLVDMVGQCIGGHQGEIEELRLILNSVDASIAGLAPALRRLKVIRFYCYGGLSSQQTGELSGIAADCDTLEEFCYNMFDSTDDFQAFCQLLSRFPNLKRVRQGHLRHGYHCDDPVFHEESRLMAFLEMVKTSKTIEQVFPSQLYRAEEEVAIKYHCRNNMVHNRIREQSFLAATVPSSAWPLILNEFSDMPDVLLYLLQQKHGAMIGPTCHGCKRKQDFD